MDDSEKARRALVERLLAQRGVVRKTVAIEPAAREQAIRTENGRSVHVLAASFPQELMWINSKLEPESPFYNVPLEVSLRGALDPDALEGSFVDLVARHEVLRTTLRLVDGRIGEIEQVVWPEMPFPFERIDLSALSVDARAKDLAALAIETAERPFDVENGPLLRAVLVREGAESHTLLICAHHAVMDGWSASILAAEVNALYTARALRAPPALKPLPIQYGDYAEWQRKKLDAPSLVAELDHWRAALLGAPRRVELPFDRPRPEVLSPKGVQHSISLSVELAAALAKQDALNATVFMKVMAALNLVLFKWSGQRDIVVGAVHANREHEELEGLLGNFVNFLAIRTIVEGNTTIRELLRRVRDGVLQAFQHQDYPFNRLVAALDAERKDRQKGLYNVVLLHQNFPKAEERSDSGLRLAFRQYGEKRSSAVDLRLILVTSPGAATLTCEYHPDLFDARTIERFVEQLVRALESVANGDSRSIDEVSLLPPTERARLLAQNREVLFASEVTEGTLVDRFRRQVAAFPTNVAVRAGDLELTYQALDVASDALAHHLVKKGARREEAIGLCVERTAAIVVGILGILKAGGTYVPLDPDYPAERLAFMTSDAEVRLVVTDDASRPHVPGGCEHVLWSAVESESLVLPDSHPDQAAYVIFTSGSTGRPKGVVVTHRCVVRLFEASRSGFEFDSTDVWTLFHSYAFDFSVWELWGALLYGGRVVVVPKTVARSPDEFFALVASEGVTVLSQTPSAFRQLVTIDASSRAVTPLALRYVVFGGEALDYRSLAPWFERRGDDRPCLVNMYGITETTVHVTYRRVRASEVDSSASFIGSALSDLGVRVLDGGLGVSAIGVPGEMFIAGAGLARGYLARPALTAERFIPDPFANEPGARLYRSGDLARYRDDGDLEYLGRADDQVKIRGFRIELGEVESALAGDGVEAAVAVLNQERGDPAIVAYVVLRTGSTLSPPELRERAKHRLADYMLPSSIVVIDALPVTPSGKVDRRALALRPITTVTDAEFSPPKNPIEDALCSIWSDVLGVPTVGTTANFFELGGHSLLAIQVMTRIKTAFDVSLPLRKLFDAPTVGELALALSTSERGVVKLPRVEPDLAHRNDPFPLTEIQQAYWLGRSSDYEMGNVSCYIYLEFNTENLDLARLRGAIQTLIRRHEMLRAVVSSTGEQRILEVVPDYVVEAEDRLADGPAAVEASLMKTRGRMRQQVLPSDVWPLFELRVTRVTETSSRLHFGIDLLIVDAGSLRILGSEFAMLYQDVTGELPRLGLSFRDYVLTERAFEPSETYRASLRYWESRIADFAGGPDLPLAVDPSKVVDPHFANHRGVLSIESWDRMKARARQHGLSASGMIMAAFAELLSAWVQSPRFTLTVTLFNRLPFHEQVDDIVGDFTSITFVDVQPVPESTFSARAKRLQLQMIEALDHRYVSGVRVLRELSKKRGAAASTVPVVFTSVLGLPRTAAPENERAFELVHSVTQTPQVWLDHQMAEIDGELVYNWDFVEELFPKGMIDDMFAAYGELLRKLADEPDSWSCGKFPLVPRAQLDRRAALETTSPLAVPTLHQAVLDHAAHAPASPAVIAPDRTLTYGELERESAAVAGWLAARGAGRGSVVAVAMHKGWEQIVAVLGVLRAGAAYLPVDAALPLERRELLMTEAGVRHVLVQSHAEEMRGSVGERGVLEVDRVAALPPNEAPDATPHADDLAYVLYTSGSTGKPKGVMISHRAARTTIEDVNRRLGVTAADRCIQLSSLGFDLSVYDVFGLLGAGGAIVIPALSDAREPGRWLELVQRAGVTVWNSVPAFVEMALDLVESKRAPLPPSLRLVMVSGDWVPVRLPTRVRAAHPTCEVVSLGGPTEAAIWQVIYPIGEVDPGWASVPYGKPLTNHRLHVFDEALEPRPDWVAGEIWIGGDGLAQGYFGDPERTAESFVVHPRSGERLYRSGDFARYLPTGDLEFLGRRDAQVKLRGHRIELGEIETALQHVAGVRDAAVKVCGARGEAQRLVAYVVADAPDAGGPADDALRQDLRTRLPDYMVPTSWLRVAALPLTANGKVDRNSLPDPEAALDATLHVDPSNAVEAVLAQVWSEVLDRDGIGIRQNFFEAGGDSVSATRMLNTVREILGTNVGFRMMYENPTIEGASRALIAADREGKLLQRAERWMDLLAETDE